LRVPSERALVTAVVTAGAATLVVPPLVGSVSIALPAAAVFAAAAVLAEYFQVPGDEDAVDPTEARTISFSSSVHLAAAVVVGPWAGAAVAACGVVTADSLHGSPWRKVAYNASVFALATFAGGHAFALLGGDPDELSRLTAGDVLAFVGMAIAYVAVNTVLIELIVSVGTRSSLVRDLLHSARVDLPTDAAEAGLGGALALFALHRPWAIVLLVPLALAVYQAHARMVLLRRQTARALETFANVVDERDPYTNRHSERVAELVAELAERLGLPAVETSQLRWSGRLHDLGKVAVDTSVLRKAAPLDPDEFEQIRRHARVSARFLRRFEFASSEALAVEYHHERYDGGGYYGIERERIPLASFFVSVADAYDAMTSERPYRPALPADVALAEIEARSGSQFHPLVAKAFVALRRGQDPLDVLTREELVELRRAAVSHQRVTPRQPVRIETGLATAIGCAVTLVGLGLAMPVLAAAGVAVVAATLVVRITLVRARRRLLDALASTPTGAGRAAAFQKMAERTGRLVGASWAGLVVSRDGRVDRVELEWGEQGRPSDAALVSWLLREHDSTEPVLVARGDEVGAAAGAWHLAVPIAHGGARVGFVVLAFPRRIPRFVLAAPLVLPCELEEELAAEVPVTGESLALAVSA
jgi:HD-GYP domain-containing protein (c-di-GMP phosphodiesterase class II)